jgi:hypothetical protein
MLAQLHTTQITYKVLTAMEVETNSVHICRKQGIRVHQLTDQNPWNLVYYLVQLSDTGTWLIQQKDTS